MTTEPILHQKKVRTMGTILAVVSSLALLVSLLLVPLVFFLGSSSWFSLLHEGEATSLVEQFTMNDELDLGILSDEDLREIFAEYFDEVEPDLPQGTTKEDFVNTVLYAVRSRQGEDVSLPEGGVVDELLSPDLTYLPDGVTGDTTLREVAMKDRAFFEAHTTSFRWLSLLAVAFYIAVAVFILRIALAWRRGDPFGRGTIHGLRWLGILFLSQFLASFLFGPFLPYSDFGDIFLHSAIYDEAAEALFNTGANLSCGIVFLTLSWVLEHGQKMKEDQALTI